MNSLGHLFKDTTVGQFLSEVGDDGYRYRLLDEEDCAEFTDVYWIKFSAISNAR